MSGVREQVGVARWQDLLTTAVFSKIDKFWCLNAMPCCSHFPGPGVNSGATLYHLADLTTPAVCTEDSAGLMLTVS